jgi:hypothetical protein
MEAPIGAVFIVTLFSHILRGFARGGESCLISCFEIEYELMDDKALFERLDKIIFLLENAAKQPSLLIRVINGAAIGAGILGILSAVDVIRSWLGG